MTKTFHAKIANDGRVVIPAPFRKQPGFHPGDTVVIEQDGDAVKISSYAQVLKEIQGFFRQYVKPGRSMVDELIAERRAEAAQEEKELAEWLAKHGRPGA
jgi:AbrB family looped-hinge helix DNA binding protein